MKKSTLILTILVVAAFLVATALGLQNPNIAETQNELQESIESSKENTISSNYHKNNGQNFIPLIISSLET